MTPVIRVSGLTRRFGGLLAVNDVEFDIDEGEIVGLIGPNGAGKTTVFNMLCGSIRPTAGTIHVRGEDCTAKSPHQMAAKGIGRTFQITSVFPALTCLENVRIATYRRGGGSWAAAVFRTRRYAHQEAAIDRIVGEILEFSGLSDHRDARAEDLSYGNQRRLEVAIALASDPKIILLDEPAAGLNPDEGQQLVNMIRTIRDRGTTVLLVEHHMRVVMTVCDRIIVLDHGVKIAEGTPAEVAANREVVRVYLGREHVTA
jgi:branched-chain amino acid transport system ATP-binding protein